MEKLPASPAQEVQPTQAEHAEDVAYTMNHALSCATADMLIAPTVAALFGVQVGCSDPSHGHDDHAHEEVHTHDHAKHEHTAHEVHIHEPHIHEPHMHVAQKPKLNWSLYKNEALHYLKGEIIGDVAAVPLTIFVQRCFPKFMDGLRRLAEPLAAPFFRWGANHAAARWAETQGVAPDSAEVVARAQAMYRSEIKHLPQAVMWNMFAFPIGVIGQKLGGHGSSVPRIIRNKFLGSLVSNGVLLGGRAVAPDIAERGDRMNSEYVIAPLTQRVSWLAGGQNTLSDVAVQHENAALQNNQPSAIVRDGMLQRERAAASEMQVKKQ